MRGRKINRPLTPAEQVYLDGLLAMREERRKQLAELDTEIGRVHRGDWLAAAQRKAQSVRP